MSEAPQMKPEVKIRPIALPDAKAVAELAGQLGYQRTPDQVG